MSSLPFHEEVDFLHLELCVGLQDLPPHRHGFGVCPPMVDRQVKQKKMLETFCIA